MEKMKIIVENDLEKNNSKNLVEKKVRKKKNLK